jgi:hypothetical protein
MLEIYDIPFGGLVYVCTKRFFPRLNFELL